MRRRAYSLVRVSKGDQAKEDRYSIPAQRRAIQKYCEEHDIELVREFEEPGTSAYVTDMAKIPGLLQAVEGIEAREATVLLFHESSRLARTERLTGEVADRLASYGASLVNVSMGIDYNASPETRMMLSTEASLNAYWSRKTSEHSRKAKREQFEQGLTIGKIPFGYTHALIEGVAGSLVTTRKLPPLIVAEEAAAISKAYEDFSNGANAHQIAREWNEAGYLVRSTKGLTYWQPQTVRDILRNRLYAGYVRHGDEFRRGLHEPIVSEELFWAAQRVVRRTVRRIHAPKLLRGIATCVEGHPIRVQPSRNSRKNPFSHYYYRESSDDIERPCAQSGKLWTTKTPDAQVEALFQTLSTDSAWLAHVDAQAKISPHRSAAAERSRIQAKLERLQGEYIEGRLPKDKWDRIFADCQDELAMLNAVEQPLVSVQAKLGSWHDLWGNASAETKNEVCRLVFEKAVIDFVKRELTLVPWPEFQPLFDCRAHYLVQEPPARGRWLLCCSGASSNRCCGWRCARAPAIPGPRCRAIQRQSWPAFRTAKYPPRRRRVRHRGPPTHSSGPGRAPRDCGEAPPRCRHPAVTLSVEWTCKLELQPARRRRCRMFFRKQPVMITPAEALPGRSVPVLVPGRHLVLGTPLQGPWPEGMKRATFAMGCFWGAEKFMWKVPGVYSTFVGYEGGFTPNPTYEEVCTQRTGHAEVAVVVYDSAKVEYDTLLKVFWENHDPTQWMRQGGDIGTQYRSAIMVEDDEQKAEAMASRDRYQAALTEAGFGEIATLIVPAGQFYYAEDYHQQYLQQNPYGYCNHGFCQAAYPSTATGITAN